MNTLRRLRAFKAVVAARRVEKVFTATPEGYAEYASYAIVTTARQLTGQELQDYINRNIGRWTEKTVTA